MAVLRSSGVSLVVSYTIFSVLSIAAVSLRFFGIRICGRPVKHHDFLCILSLVCCIGYAIDTLVGTVNGVFGLHMEEAAMFPEQLVVSLKTFFASQFLWATSISAFRLAILLLYLEIFPQRLFRRSTYACMGIVSLFWVACMITILANCRPIQYNWNRTIEGSCGDIGDAELSAAAINMVLDIVIVLLPLPLVWKLQMPTRKKIAVSITFALGLIISGINLARIIELLHCPIEDFTYCTRDSAILTVAEMAVGIIVACVPTFGVLLPKRMSDSSGPPRFQRPDAKYYDRTDNSTKSLVHPSQARHNHNASASFNSKSGSQQHHQELELDERDLDGSFYLATDSGRHRATCENTGVFAGPPLNPEQVTNPHRILVRQNFDIRADELKG